MVFVDGGSGVRKKADRFLGCCWVVVGTCLVGGSAALSGTGVVGSTRCTTPRYPFADQLFDRLTPGAADAAVAFTSPDQSIFGASRSNVKQAVGLGADTLLAPGCDSFCCSVIRRSPST